MPLVKKEVKVRKTEVQSRLTIVLNEELTNLLEKALNGKEPEDFVVDLLRKELGVSSNSEEAGKPSVGDATDLKGSFAELRKSENLKDIAKKLLDVDKVISQAEYDKLVNGGNLQGMKPSEEAKKLIIQYLTPSA